MSAEQLDAALAARRQFDALDPEEQVKVAKAFIGQMLIQQPGTVVDVADKLAHVMAARRFLPAERSLAA